MYQKICLCNRRHDTRLLHNVGAPRGGYLQMLQQKRERGIGVRALLKGSLRPLRLDHSIQPPTLAPPQPPPPHRKKY